MKINSLLTIIFFILLNYAAISQIEDVPVNSPVYDFLLRMETKGMLPHFSLSKIPLQKQSIINSLQKIRSNDSLLTKFEQQTLSAFEKYYINDTPVKESERIMFFNYNFIDTNDLVVYDNLPLFYYNYADSAKNITVLPLLSSEFITGNNISGKNNNLLMGTLGFRFSGSLKNKFGYFLQITNTAMLKGDSSLALLDSKYSNSKKFTEFNSDADISESHITYQDDWFYAKISRATTLFGAGLNQRIIISDMSPAFDAITLGAKFNSFEYAFSHSSILNFPVSESTVGAGTIIPPKYVAMHNISFLPEWGEITFYETLIYSRALDLAYLNPLSFFKSLEHSLRDRDNAGMGILAVYRPIRNFQLKLSWFLDDIKFSEIGKNYWSNKTAWNISAITSVIPNLDFGIEYTRVEPYTFSHFNPQNSSTNDSILLGSYILPNSDRWNALFQYWFGGVYPLKLNIFYTRHGKNIYDTNGDLIKNVGADPLQSIRWEQDNERVKFLDGDLIKTIGIECSIGYHIYRGLTAKCLFNYCLQNNNISSSYARLLISYTDF